MSNSDEFLSQECYIYLPRLEGIDQASRQTRSKRNLNEVDSESESETNYRTSNRMSRPTRKRGSGEVEEPPQHTNKAKGGPLSVKKVKFGLNYDPDKDNLSFIPVNPDKYTPVSVIIQPTYSDAVSDWCCFPLTKTQSKKINVDNYCVLLRLAYFNKQDGGYEDIFDYGMNIRVNDVALPLTAPTEEDPNAPLDGPADITRYLIAEGASIERVRISFDGQAKPHIFSIIFCKKKKDELPFVSLRYLVPNQTFKLAHRVNERFMTDMNKLFRKVYTLLDPISKQRIETPVRGASCSHVECFDLNTFLRANRRKLEWSCPICSKQLKEDQIVVDGLFNSIIAKTYTSCTAVELDSQGGWSPVYREKVFRVRTVDLENDISEGEDDEEPEEEIRSPEGPLSPVDVPPELEEPEVSLEENEFHGGMNGDEPMNISKEAETQTGHLWSPSYEGENSASAGENPDQSEPDVFDHDTNEAAIHGNPTTVIQRVDDDRSHEMEEAQ